MVDIALAYKQEPIVIFDLTRTQADKMDHVYALIEGFKNGRLLSPKYASQAVPYAPCCSLFFPEVRPCPP
jgi:hypothetical protein